MHPLYTTREIRPGFWSAERDGIKRFGRTEPGAIAQCKRAWLSAPKDSSISQPASQPNPPKKPAAKRIPREVHLPATSPPIAPTTQQLVQARFHPDHPGPTLSAVTAIQPRYEALVRSVCPHRLHSDICGCTGFQVRRPSGEWTPSMSRQSTFAFCRLNRWEWRLVPRLPI